MTTEYDEMLGYDADHDDPRQFCRHGTFIGSWWGPDYMCFDCEMGTTDKEFFLGGQYSRIRSLQNQIIKIYPFDDQSMASLRKSGFPYSAQFADFLVRHVLASYDELRWLEIQLLQARLQLVSMELMPDSVFTNYLEERNRDRYS